VRTDLDQYTYCEPPNVAANRPRCIRRMTNTGRHLFGGIDTESLCGRVKPLDVGGFGGHDFSMPVEQMMEPREVCKACLAVLRNKLDV
jgi:hypothetical protein